MKIAIIGGGWVGCHLATKLKKTHEVTLYEKNTNLFKETSYYNQNRLHYGFHYARNSETRNLCKSTFNVFIEDYGFCVETVE
jgi:L-2-hydroxyglutarate oxidase LhgO